MILNVRKHIELDTIAITQVQNGRQIIGLADHGVIVENGFKDTSKNAACYCSNV
jgi:hypothetical protein